MKVYLNSSMFHTVVGVVAAALLIVVLPEPCFGQDVLRLNWSYGMDQGRIKVTRTKSTMIASNGKVVTTYTNNPVINLVYGPGSHDVWEFPNRRAYKKCDFSQATQVCNLGNTGTNCFLEPETSGAHYYGCKVQRHCKDGNMKFKVKLKNKGQRNKSLLL